MTATRPSPGQIIDLQPLGAAFSSTKTTALVKSENLEVIRLIIPAGKEIPPHRAPGEITVHCLEGKVFFTALGRGQEMRAGQMLFLPAKEEHSLKAIEDASVLVTILL